MPNEEASNGLDHVEVEDSEKSGAALVTREEIIQGGSISGLDQEVNWRLKKHHAETASRLALLLVWVLVGTIGIHYIGVATLSILGIPQAVQGLESTFDKTLPVLAGFVGGAVTYYFTKERGQ